MKKTKKSLKILTALMSLMLVIGAVLAIGIFSVSATENVTEEETDNRIPVPEVPNVKRPLPDTSSFNVDMKAIFAYFPQELEISFGDGIIYVKDFGAGSATFSSPEGYFEMELVDGFWIAEIGERSNDYEIMNFYYSRKNERCSEWLVSYVNGSLDPNMEVRDWETNIAMALNANSDLFRLLYQHDDYNVEDSYKYGLLESHEVFTYSDEVNEGVKYNPDGSIKYATIYKNGFYYYFPEQGWSSSWSTFIQGDAPEGYENVDETYFIEKIPFTTCKHTECSEATCTSPMICNECGEAVGEASGHVWGEPGDEISCICTVCNEPLIPDFEFIIGAYPNIDATGFPYKEVIAAFPEEIETKYENGKYYVKNIGAISASGFTNIDFNRVGLSLVDGYWVYDVNEEIYNNEDVDIYIEFYGKDTIWQVSYKEGKLDGSIQFLDIEVFKSVLISPTDETVIAIYSVNNAMYNDVYNGDLTEQTVEIQFDNNWISVEYDSSGNITSVQVLPSNTGWVYYYEGYGWATLPGGYDPENACDTPEGLEGKGLAFFESIAPSTLNCEHSTFNPADCINPERCTVCGLAKEGSVALGHDIVTVERIEPTCTELGMTEGSFCTRCTNETIGCEILPMIPHEIVTDDAVPPTCTDTGFTEGEHCVNCDTVTVLQNEVPALGHTFADATLLAPKICTVCGETEGDPLSPESESTSDKTEENSGTSTSTQAAPQNKGGCGSSIGLGSIAIITTLGAAFVLGKKKEK